MKSFAKYFNLTNFTLFLIVVFCIRYIPVDSRDGISYFKIAVSFVCPIIFLIYTPKISKPFLVAIMYYLILVFSAIFQTQSVRWTTLIFQLSYLLMFLTFYNLVYELNVLTSSVYVRFLKKFIIAYFITLIIQQIALILGVREFALINLCQFIDRGIGSNSLSGEPSTQALILTFTFFSLIRMLELSYNRPLSFGEIYKEAKWPTIGFLWCMLTMGSGTAFICLGILLCYFIKPRYYVSTALLLVVLYFAVMHIEFTPLQRARDSFLAFLTLDRAAVSDADGSAAARIVPIVNTITELDLTTVEGWFGHGIDYGFSKGLFSDRVMIGGIADYGFLSYIVLLIFVYSTMIRKFFSLETVLWFGILLGSLSNEPFRWGAMMLFTVVRYFQIQKENGCLDHYSKL